jgi:hypothetical protein
MKLRKCCARAVSANLQTPVVHGFILMDVGFECTLFEVDQAVPQLRHHVQRVRFCLEPARNFRNGAERTNQSGSDTNSLIFFMADAKSLTFFKFTRPELKNKQISNRQREVE